MIPIWLRAASEITSWAWIFYLFLCSVMASNPAEKKAKWNTAWIILKWLSAVDPLLTLIVKTMDRSFNGWTVLFILVQAGLWWWFRNLGDDDFTKKTKKKITEAVAVIKGRLTIVPSPAGA